MISPEQLAAAYTGSLRARAFAFLVRDAAHPAEREAFGRIAAGFEDTATVLEVGPWDEDLHCPNAVRMALNTTRELCKDTRLPALLADYVTAPSWGALGFKPIQPDTSDPRLAEWEADLHRRFDTAHDALNSAADATSVRAALALVLELQLEAVRLTAAIKGDGPGRRDWSTMRAADFDRSASLTLVDADAVRRPVPATPDECGTEALFGETPTRPRATRTRRPAPAPTMVADTLF